MYSGLIPTFLANDKAETNGLSGGNVGWSAVAVAKETELLESTQENTMWHAKPVHALVFTIAAVVALLASLLTQSARADDWSSLRSEIFADRAIASGSGVFELYAPAQAADAAVVPISVRLPDNLARKARKLTLVIDRNPAPVVATIEFGDGFRGGEDVGEKLIETRVRVDSFSQLRAIVETDDDRLYMTSKFVAGAGGCSATTGKDPEAALAGLGKLKVEVLRNDIRGPAWRDIRVAIQHPNFTGMQMDPVSRGYTPARFVDRIAISRSGELIAHISGGISVSENPHFRFTLGVTSDEPIDVLASDTAGKQFRGTSGLGGS